MLKPDQEEIDSDKYEGDYTDGDDYCSNVIAWFNQYVHCDLMSHLLTTFFLLGASIGTDTAT